jgi:deoxyribodipyrimidine photo-lyase
MPTLLWFRRDLRLRDHPALTAAADDDAEVLACFVLDPQLEASSGERRLQFLRASLARLRDDLDGRLLVTRGRPEQQIPRMAKEIGASSVHISEDFAPFGKRRDERVRAALDSVPLVATGSPYPVSPGRVTKNDGSPYKVFTPYLREWRNVGWRPPAQTGAESARWLDPARLSIKQCEIPNTNAELDVAAGEAAALRQWKSFVHNRLQRYDEDRNRPDLAGTSRMSAYLKFGTIHPRTMVADLDLSGTGARAYLRELAFRDFYADVLHHWPASSWRNWNSRFDGIQTDTRAEAQRRF